MADTVVPRYKVDASGELVPDVRAAAAIIYDPETDEVLFEENAQSQRSIASITKVMTATVFLETDPDLTEVVTVVRNDVYRASTTYLRANDKLTTGDLLHLLLIASDNAASRVLARVSPARHRGLHRPHEHEGRRARPRDHALRRHVGPAVGQHVVGLRHGAAHRARIRRRADLIGHAEERAHRADGAPQRHRPQHQPAPRTRRCGRDGREDGLHLEVGILLRDAPAPPADAASRSRSSSSAPGRTPAASWKRRTCSTGCPTRPPRFSPRRLPPSASARRNSL